MSNALQVNGAQSDKQVKFAPMYVGRIFSGIYTNRSPLRDAASGRVEEKYYGPRGDAMIAGLNVEVTNRLTLSRRPGTPIYDTFNTFTDILAFDEFRINKAISDLWGTTLEQIDVMVDTKTALYADNGASVSSKQLVWTKTVSAAGTAGQTNMQAVGNQLYFGNGVDNKKWNQSLFMRVSANNSLAVDTDAYPLMKTFYIDPNNNIQQMFGVSYGAVNSPSTIANVSITHVAISGNVLTLTTTPNPAVGTISGGGDQPIGTYFMLWGFTNTNTTFLNGATIQLTADYPIGGTTITAELLHADMSQSDTGILQEIGGSPFTGSTVPTWGTVVPNAGDLFLGSITLDGNVLWYNRGTPVQNWGIAAPSGGGVGNNLTYTVSASAAGWQANTYYSPASIYIDNVSGYLWQITTPGKTGATQPAWPASPAVVQQKVDVTSTSVTSNVVTVTTSTQSPAFAVGDVITMANLDVSSFLNGAKLVVLASGLTTTQFEANFTYPDYPARYDEGVAYTVGTTQADGDAIWTVIQTPTSLTWAAHHHYYEGDFLVGVNGGVRYFFQLAKNTQPHLIGPIVYNAWPSDNDGAVDKVYPSGAGSITTPTPGSLQAMNVSNGIWTSTGGTPPYSTTDMLFYDVNGAGEITTNTSSGYNNPYEASFVATLYVPKAGTFTFTLNSDDAGWYSFDGRADSPNTVVAGAYKVLGSYTESVHYSPGRNTRTIFAGYGGTVANITSGANLCGSNNNLSSNPTASAAGAFTSTATWSFPQAGTYSVEICYANSHAVMIMQFLCNGQVIAITPDESGSVQPLWPAFTTTGASYNSTLGLIQWGATVQEAAKQYTWSNIGPVSDFGWHPNIYYTLPGSNIVDTLSNEQAAYETGYTGTTAPSWTGTVPNGIIADPNPFLKWINEGNIPTSATSSGKITATSTKGWTYAIALVNTLDNTVSNIGPLSASTGPVVNGQIVFAPGAGLVLANIDPQADYVAIYRTTDGFSTELLIPGNGNTIWTVPLAQYLRYGYVDTTPDTGLDELVQAAAAFENTPPLPGAINLAYALNRIWYSIGNTVFWTSGPLDPSGNGINGFAPNNFDVQTALVKRLVPTAIGMMVFTVSDIAIIPNDSAGNILPSLIYVPGVGLGNYNALDVNGPTIGFFTTDSQFVNFSPSIGVSWPSFNIADRFALRDGGPGTNWIPSDVYVAYYTSGQDVGWFVSDGSQGWYRVFQNNGPDPGEVWCPFSQIVNGVHAIKSVEVSPGIHKLLLGHPLDGVAHYITNRSLTASSDGGTTDVNGATYPAYAVFGSYVLSQPGQVAQVAFITTKSVHVGSPLVIGLLIDEALPYYTGSFEMLKNWVPDPPDLKPSKSFYTQRFYLSDMPDTAAACTDIQLMVQWPPESAINELQTFTVFGCYVQEQ